LGVVKNLSNIGRIFYGAATAVIGFETIYNKDFHAYLLPANHSWLPGIAVLAFSCGTLLILAGVCIALNRRTRPISALLGGVFLLIVCFYYIPYEFIATKNYMHLGEWENAGKEFALAGGAFIIAGCFPEKNKISAARFLEKLLPLGTVFFSLVMIGFSMLHFTYANQAADYVPSWAPNHLFWIYFAGLALLGSGVGILFNIKRLLMALLLGSMIFIWFISLHIPRVIASSTVDMANEVISAFLALAYSGTAFVIAGCAKKKPSERSESF
jgi:uncharacterized membrane protein YphA (DoxX/SURF4 family)